MSPDDQASTDEPLPVPGGWRCHSAQALFVLAAHRSVANSWSASAEERASTKSSSSTLAADVARQFQLETGHASSAVAVTAAADDKLALACLLAQGGSCAAVLLMDEDVLGRLWPPCDWMTPLLQVRNRLADEGSKFFVALTTPPKETGFPVALRRLRARFVARRVGWFCNREGIGFLGTINMSPLPSISSRMNPFHERVEATIAHRLASATFFCCDAFRIGGGRPIGPSQYQGK